VRMPQGIVDGENRAVPALVALVPGPIGAREASITFGQPLPVFPDKQT
jgi:hypothetical protein